MDDDVWTEVERVRTLLDLHRPADAEKAACALLARHPQTAEAHGLLAIARSRRRRHAEAERSAREAMALEPDDPTHPWRLAIVLATAGQQRLALAPLEESLRMAPWFVEAHILHAELRLNLGEAAAARDAAELALAMVPDDAAALTAYSRALRALGETEDALDAAEAALAEAPGSPDAHLAYGWASLQAGDRGAGLRHFREALRLNPGDPVARASLLEALRARSGPYALVLRASLWLEGRRLGGLDLTGGGIGLLILTLGVIRVADVLPWWTIAPIMSVGAVVLLAGLARRLSDALLLFDPENRHVFTPIERRSAIATVATIAWVVATALLSAVAGVSGFFAMLGVAMVLLSLYPSLTAEGWLRTAMRAWSALMSATMGVVIVAAARDPARAEMAQALTVLLLPAALVPYVMAAVADGVARFRRWRWERAGR